MSDVNGIPLPVALNNSAHAADEIRSGVGLVHEAKSKLAHAQRSVVNALELLDLGARKLRPHNPELATRIEIIADRVEGLDFDTIFRDISGQPK